MNVNLDTIHYLAKLARLKIRDEEAEVLRIDLEKMIGFVETLQNLNTDNVEPLLHMTEEIDRLRKDEAVSLPYREEALKQAPHKDNQFFLVPKVIKHNS